ncbi:hypothetical protein ABD76_16850 [Paenibacillus dendritiformis]|nr:hypothetical protein [Paenibacillus dendritiformis]
MIILQLLIYDLVETIRKIAFTGARRPNGSLIPRREPAARGEFYVFKLLKMKGITYGACNDRHRLNDIANDNEHLCEDKNEGERGDAI